MKTAMEAIKDMVDVDTVIGSPVETKAGGVIIPISRVSFGFMAGGGEYSTPQAIGVDGELELSDLPFAGGSGAGISVNPVGFLVVQNEDVRLLPVAANQFVDRIVDRAPDLLDRISQMIHGNGTGTGEYQEPSEATSYR